MRDSRALWPVFAVSILATFAACGVDGAVPKPGEGGSAMVQGSGGNDPGDSDAPGGELFRSDRVLELRIEMAVEAWQAILDNPQAEAYQHADLRFGDTVVNDVAVRTKGNSSLHSAVQMGSIRYPFKVDLNYYVEDQKLDGKKKFVLNSSFKDPSFVQEYLAYAMLRDLGLPAPRTAWVDLWVADQHLGLYTLVEAVDGDFVEQRFADDTGDLYKPETMSGTLRDLGDDISAYTDLELKSNEESSDGSAFLGLIAALNHGEPLANALDVDEALMYLASSTALVNLDSYLGMGHNYYLYEQAGVFSIIPWDLNEAFGTFTCRCDNEQIRDFLIDEPTCDAPADRPLVARLLADNALRQQYHTILQQVLDTHLNADVMGPRIQAAAALLRPFVQDDPTKFYSVDDFERRVDTSDTSNTQTLLGWIAARKLSVQAQLDGVQDSSGEGLGACDGGGPTNPPVGQASCADGQSCPDNLVCAPGPMICVPDCRVSTCPASRPTCNQSTGLCD